MALHQTLNKSSLRLVGIPWSNLYDKQ